jgi:hypothetical protein
VSIPLLTRVLTALFILAFVTDSFTPDTASCPFDTQAVSITDGSGDDPVDHLSVDPRMSWDDMLAALDSSHSCNHLEFGGPDEFLGRLFVQANYRSFSDSLSVP